jgi:hypothetical protein
MVSVFTKGDFSAVYFTLVGVLVVGGQPFQKQAASK